MNYGELKTSIQDYCQNSETSFVAHIPDFVRSAEDKTFLSVQMPAFWKSDSTLVTASGTSEYPLSAGSVDIFSVRVGETAVSVAEPVQDGPSRYLLRKDYGFLLEAYPGSSASPTTGTPKYYAVSDASILEEATEPTMTIRLGPIPDAIYPVTVDYYGKTAADSITVSDSTTTWLSVVFPDTLLYGSLVEAYIYMKGEPDLIQTYTTQFQNSLMMIKNLGEGRQTSDSFVSGAKRVDSQ